MAGSRRSWRIRPADRYRPANLRRRRPNAAVRRGQIYVWHPELGAFELHGLIAVMWLSLGLEQFGYPFTDELGCPDGRGRFNHSGRCSYPTDQSRRSTGHRRPRRTRCTEQSASRGRSTASNSDRSATRRATSTTPLCGGRRNEFERGFIDWTRQHGAQVHGPVHIDEGTNLHPVDN